MHVSPKRDSSHAAATENPVPCGTLDQAIGFSSPRWGDGTEICKGKVSCDNKILKKVKRDKRIRHGVGDIVFSGT